MATLAILVGVESMFCGPSEVTAVCDKDSNPEWIASDLVGQAEHSDLVQCILISKDKNIIEKTRKEILKQLKEIPRSSIAKTPLMLANSVGIIDAGYRGNLIAAVKYVPTFEILCGIMDNSISEYLLAYEKVSLYL